MYPVNHQQYRQLFQEIQQEFDYSDETCFVRTAAQLFLHEITVEDYFDRLISHLEVDAVLHTFDKAKSTKLEDLFSVDLISGAVKSLMLNRSFRRLQPSDAAKLKRLCVLAYHIDGAEDLCREAAAADALLASLPPRWLDILAIIAYARRHVTALQHLVTYPAPSTKSTFDLLGTGIISKRREPNMAFQHSPDSAENRLIEIRLWTALLQADTNWIHYPMTDGPGGLYAGLHWLVDYFGHEHQLRASPEVEKICRVFSDIGIVIGVSTLSRFLSITAGHLTNFPDGIVPCGLAQATMLLSCFPLFKVAADNGEGKLEEGASADLILPLTQWGTENPDRLVVMRMLLEQRCDPNDRISHNGWRGFLTARQRDTALHLAAERGDEAMVDLLLEFGARGDLTGSGGEGDTPSERARAHGYPRIAARIEG